LKDFHYGVFIGRFQPLHVGHQHIITEALKRVETLIIGVGSAWSPRTPVNPFTYSDRVTLLQLAYRHEIEEGRIKIVPLHDHALDTDWARAVQDAVDEVVLSHANKGGVRLSGTRDFKIALTGYGKDASSFYLNMFPQWNSIQIETQHGTINASDIRHDYIRRLPRYPHDAVHGNVLGWLKSFALTEDFKDLVAYKEQLGRDLTDYGTGPFLAADALVTHKGKVLLVTRGKAIGKGLLAMPGGFVNANERIFDAAIRELAEETTIENANLGDFVVGHMLADDPKRSLRGRVVSTVFHFKIPEEVELKRPVGSDDAAHADWYDFDDLDPTMFFDDHYNLIHELIR
jgi:bifunctional NMN adenylyltransferase/nudix hydrolase